MLDGLCSLASCRWHFAQMVADRCVEGTSLVMFSRAVAVRLDAMTITTGFAIAGEL